MRPVKKKLNLVSFILSQGVVRHNEDKILMPFG